MTSLRVASFNIRMGTANDGPNAWQVRKEETLRHIVSLDADIVVLQEVLDFQLMAIAQALPDYSWIGVGREDGDQEGEFCPICFRAPAVLRSWSTQWISETPEVPNSISWNSACTRIATIAEFEGYRVVNTHWDHIYADARLESAKLILSLEPDLLMGDLNAEPESPEVQCLIGSGLVSGVPMNTTFHDFGRDESGPTIDYILAKEIHRLEAGQILENFIASDHHAITAKFIPNVRD